MAVRARAIRREIKRRVVVVVREWQDLMQRIVVDARACLPDPHRPRLGGRVRGRGASSSSSNRAARPLMLRPVRVLAGDGTIVRLVAGAVVEERQERGLPRLVILHALQQLLVVAQPVRVVGTRPPSPACADACRGDLLAAHRRRVVDVQWVGARRRRVQQRRPGRARGRRRRRLHGAPPRLLLVGVGVTWPGGGGSGQRNRRRREGCRPLPLLPRPEALHRARVIVRRLFAVRAHELRAQHRLVVLQKEPLVVAVHAVEVGEGGLDRGAALVPGQLRVLYGRERHVAHRLRRRQPPRVGQNADRVAVHAERRDVRGAVADSVPIRAYLVRHEWVAVAVIALARVARAAAHCGERHRRGRRAAYAARAAVGGVRVGVGMGVVAVHHILRHVHGGGGGGGAATAPTHRRGRGAFQ
ncbi:hypothetical protein STCU_11948 [Strigomonas culicis]|uniref:Uncharacterized protein n=1 Tax=Strigomonas culicis TaxID=28005 RepID=S9ULH0_9TRYP|nr:hypothetical protein STCU_11948 [Strigomonas culicis]|eukprot:EPY15531.1 hypothetical protein STCU_11948 [Strigomonas culicis]